MNGLVVDHLTIAIHHRAIVEPIELGKLYSTNADKGTDSSG